MTTLQRLLAGALLMGVPGTASAQAIWGTVVDDSTGAPIAGVAIEARTLRGAVATSVTSDANGAFRMSLRSAGNFNVVAAHIAYRSPEPARVDVSQNTVVSIELRLGRTAIPLRPLVVIAERDVRIAGFYDRMGRAGAGRFIHRDEIADRPGARTTDLLAEVPGVELIRVGGGLRPRTSLIALRGAAGRVGRCTPTIYVDGLPMEQYPESTVDDFVRPEILEGVEIYAGSSSAPPPIEARSGCGVVAFWTRPVESGGRFSMRRLLMGGVALAVLATMVILGR